MPLNCQTSRTGLQPRAFHILHTSDATLKSPYGLRPTPQPVPNRRPRSTPDRGASHPGRRLPDPPPIIERSHEPHRHPRQRRHLSRHFLGHTKQAMAHVADNYSPTGHNGYNASTSARKPTPIQVENQDEDPHKPTQIVHKSCTNPAYSALNSSHNLSAINRIRARTTYTTRFLAHPSSPLHPINRPNRRSLVPIHPQRGVSLRTRRAHAQCPTASTSS